MSEVMNVGVMNVGQSNIVTSGQFRTLAMFFNGQLILPMRVLQGASEMFSCGGDKSNDAKEPLGALEVGEKRELLPDTKNLHLLCSGDQ